MDWASACAALLSTASGMAVFLIVTVCALGALLLFAACGAMVFYCFSSRKAHQLLLSRLTGGGSSTINSLFDAEGAVDSHDDVRTSNLKAPLLRYPSAPWVPLLSYYYFWIPFAQLLLLLFTQLLLFLNTICSTITITLYSAITITFYSTITISEYHLFSYYYLWVPFT